MDKITIIIITVIINFIGISIGIHVYNYSLKMFWSAIFCAAIIFAVDCWKDRDKEQS